MEETLEIYEQYYDNYTRSKNYDDYYDYISEMQDNDWSDNSD